MTQSEHFSPAVRAGDHTAELRGKILALEAAMKAMPEHQVELVTVHHFAPGMYLRELRIPKGTTLTGKIHKTEHLNILSRGRLRVMTEDGMKDLEASQVIVSKPGMKRAGFALEDSVWITAHPNPENLRDVKKLEDLLVVDTYEQLEAFFKEAKQLKEEPPCLFSPQQ